MYIGFKDFEQSFIKYLCASVAWCDTVPGLEKQAAGYGHASVFLQEHLPVSCSPSACPGCMQPGKGPWREGCLFLITAKAFAS